MALPGWLPPALPAIESFIDFQFRSSRQSGVAYAVAYKGTIVLEGAHGHANLSTAEPLTPRHRLRVASHSKSFTAAGIMKLRELGLISLEDTAGKFIPGLHPDAAAATIAQLLSHTAGLIRDGPDGGQFADTRPYLSEREVVEDLSGPQVLPTGVRVKYSNHGFALLGMIISRITNEPFTDWITKSILQPAGLLETTPDITLLPSDAKFANGHTARVLLGERLVIPADNPSNAMSSAAGFVSTPGDLTKFFAQLDPNAENSVLTASSRREMTRRHWKIPHISPDQYYGLGTASGTVGSWDWTGHGGAFQGVLSKTKMVSSHGITVSVIVNALDGTPDGWAEGILHILQAYEKYGPPSEQTKDWIGRYWSIWGTSELYPFGGNKVLVARPALMNPLVDATETEVDGDEGVIVMAGGYGSHGEKAKLVRDGQGKVVEVQLGGAKNVLEETLVEEVKARYK